jgi:hypothetical protein
LEDVFKGDFPSEIIIDPGKEIQNEIGIFFETPDIPVLDKNPNSEKKSFD